MPNNETSQTPAALAARLFSSQHAVAAHRQLRRAGITWGRQQRMIAANQWKQFAPGVVALAGSPPTWHQRAMAATLSFDGSMLSGVSAARLHRLDGFLDSDAIEIVLPYGGHDNTPADITVRWSRRLTSADRHVVDGIPVTIVPVTLIHLAADGLNAGKALDSALRQGKSPLWFKQHFERWRTDGVRGPTIVLDLLAERMGKRLPRSWFQRLAKTLLEQEGIELADEWPVRDSHGALLAELDLAQVELMVGVECQSIAYHATAADMAKDIRRKRALRRLGWDIVELWWSDLDRMDEVRADLRFALDRARRLLA